MDANFVTLMLALVEYTKQLEKLVDIQESTIATHESTINNLLTAHAKLSNAYTSLLERIEK